MPESSLQQSMSISTTMALDEEAGQIPHRANRKFGVIKEIKMSEDTDMPLIGVDFTAKGSDDLEWFLPDSLEPLHVGDKLDTMIIECFEDGSDTVSLSRVHCC